MSQLESSALTSPSLARYLYVASLLRGRRVLDIGSGGAKNARFIADRGARGVLSLHIDGPPGNPASLGVNASARSIARGELTRAGGLSAAAGSEPFDVVFLHATPELLSAGFLAEVRRVLAKNGHLIVAARSKESFANLAEAVGYFDLLDGLTQAGYGPVSMLGQTPFFGAAVVPFNTNEPPLFFDDTLAPPEQPEEYVALCGPLPPSALPYQVVKLARPEGGAKSEARPAAVDSALGVERDQLKGRVEMLLADLEQRQQELAVVKAAQRGLEDRLRAAESATKTASESSLAEKTALKAEQQKLEKRLEEALAAQRLADSQRHELEEQKRQRERGESEAGQAAMLHERQMRELRTALEEREAFVAELEEQARELPRISEQLVAARKLAEDSQKSERQSRQRLAEVEGLLIRAKGELKDREKDSRLAAELETRQRELEAERRSLVLQRVELEQGEQSLLSRRSAVEQAEKAVQNSKAGAEKDAALAEVRRELLSAQERLQQLHAELEQRTRALTESQGEIDRLRQAAQAAPPPRVENTALLVAPTLGSGRRADSDGVPLLVGDMPTAPVLVGGLGGEGQPSLQQEISQLRQRVAELNSENERLKDKATEAERETWKHMKARSEAEQVAAEVREDTVRKLRDARKLASVELTRAMEDATKKAGQLREELARTEAERKEALGQLKELRSARDVALEQAAASKQELDSLRWSQGAAAAVAGGSSADLSEERQRALATLNEERTARQAAQQAADEAQLRVAELRSAVMALEQAVAETRDRADSEQRRVESLEEELRQAGSDKHKQGNSTEQLRLQQELQQQSRALAERTAERDALARLLTEVEREAAARAERARAMRVRLSEREREVEALRVELGDRERKLSALEQKSPPSEEMARLESELQTTRRRISELLDETARTEQHGDDAVATALRERARAVRMNESLDQASRERDEARSRTIELEQRLKEAQADAERLRLELVQRGHGQGSSAHSTHSTHSTPSTHEAESADGERRPASNGANNG